MTSQFARNEVEIALRALKAAGNELVRNHHPEVGKGEEWTAAFYLVGGLSQRPPPYLRVIREGDGKLHAYFEPKQEPIAGVLQEAERLERAVATAAINL